MLGKMDVVVLMTAMVQPLAMDHLAYLQIQPNLMS
jgi:hypothetical protein